MICFPQWLAAQASVSRESSLTCSQLRHVKYVSCSVVSDSWDPIDCSSPGSSVHGILQARILEWVVISSSKGSSWTRDGSWVSCIAGGFWTVQATRGSPSWDLTFLCIIDFPDLFKEELGGQVHRHFLPFSSSFGVWSVRRMQPRQRPHLNALIRPLPPQLTRAAKVIHRTPPDQWYSQALVESLLPACPVLSFCTPESPPSKEEVAAGGPAAPHGREAGTAATQALCSRLEI